MQISSWTIIFISFDFKFGSTQKSRTTENPLATTFRTTNQDISRKASEILEKIRILVYEYGGGFRRGHSVQIDGRNYHLGLYGYRQVTDNDVINDPHCYPLLIPF